MTVSEQGSSGGADERTLTMRDIMDGQLESRGGRELGRVADIEAEWRHDGTLVLTNLVVGPQALAGRVSSRLRPVARWLLRDRFEHRIPISEVAKLDGGTIHLRGPKTAYSVGSADDWIYRHLLRFIPGNGGPVPENGGDA